jgi:hypothetical protein
MGKGKRTMSTQRIPRRGRRLTVAAGLALVAAAAAAFAQTTDGLPHFEKRGKIMQLIVDGNPFLILGGQVNNPTGFPDRMERAWPKFKEMNLNTVEFPVYWGQIEPQEGRFDFSNVDAIIRGLRSNGWRAVPLWFGTYKNGAMDYVPDWVKADINRFPRVLDRAGNPIRVLSPHGAATLAADKKAYTELLRHLKLIDGTDHTVILMQVENESGILGSPRDYAPEPAKLYAGAVPDALVKALGKRPGTWKEVFGRRSEEMFTGYYMSSFIDAVAKAGREAYALPTYINVWMGGAGTNDRTTEFDYPGHSYPSGGPQSHMIDLWKANAPDIDLIGPDIYHQNPRIYRMILDRYARADNPLFVVETRGSMSYARFLFYALVDDCGIGFTPYGMDRGSQPGLADDYKPVAADFALLRKAMPVFARLQSEGRLQAAVEEEFVGGQMLYFDNYDILVRFRPPVRSSGQPPAPSGPPDPSGRVFVGQLGQDEFLVGGFDCALDFKPALGSRLTGAQALSMEEGEYTGGEWKRTEIRNGDMSSAGLAFRTGGALVRIKLMRY